MTAKKLKPQMLSFLQVAVLEISRNVKGPKIVLSECINKLNGIANEPCEPNAGGKEKGVIAPFTRTGETVVVIQVSAECAIGESSVGWQINAKGLPNLVLTHLVKHLVEVGPLTEL
jgi:hypothetical protein